MTHGGFQLPCAAMHSALELPLRQSDKPALHERGFVSGVVIQNQMQVQLRRDSVV
jgi:hypothetical protein